MARKAKAVAKRSRSRSTKKVAAKKAAPAKKAKKVVAKKAAPAKKGRGKAMGPWLKKVHKAKNGATYVKNKRG